MKEKLQEYADLKSVIKQAENKIKELKPEIDKILVELNPEDDNKVETDFGTFSRVPKRKYKYSTEVEVLSDKVKEMKETEEQTGTAEYTIEPYILFKPKEE